MLYVSQAYMPKRRTPIQVLPICKFFCYLLITNICISVIGVRIGWRKYLNECTPFGYVSLWFLSIQFESRFHNLLNYKLVKIWIKI